MPALLVPGAVPAAQGGVACAAADGARHVGVVVQHSDGRSWSRCISFTATSVTGEQALDASGIEHQYYDYGGGLGRGVCQVDGEPATPAGGWTRDNCLGYPYWSTWSARGGSWSGARQGISNTGYADGDAEGLRYGDGSGPPPPALGVCPRPPSPQPPPASPGPRPPAQPPATEQAPATAPAVTAAVPPSPSPSPSPTPSASPTPSPFVFSQFRASPFRPSIGWVAASAAALALVGLLAGQLLVRGRRA